MTDILDLILADHKSVLSLFDMLIHHSTAREKEHLIATIAKEIVQHNVAEEQVFYPLIERVMTLGPAEAKQHSFTKEQHEVEMLLAEALKMSADDPAFTPLAQKITHEATRHIIEEEQDVIPQIRAKIPKHELTALAGHFAGAKHVAPIRPRMERK